MLDPMAAGDIFAPSFMILFTSFLTALIAIVSPVINTVDLIGSGITTLMQSNDEESRTTSTLQPAA
jgi:hypothetical protein